QFNLSFVRLGRSRGNLEAGREVNAARRLKLGPCTLQVVLKRRFQFVVQQQVGPFDADLNAIAFGGRDRPSTTAEVAALVRAPEVVELPLMGLDLQRARDVFKRIRKDLVAQGSLMEADGEAIGKLAAAAVTTNDRVDIHEARWAKRVRH